MSAPVRIDRCDLHHGDCLDVLRGMDEASVDSVVTDPPYGLEFMGKDWDTFKTGRGEKYARGGKLDKEAIQSRSGKGGAGPEYVNRPVKRCAICGKQAWSGSPCKCERPEWRLDNSPLHSFQEWCEAWAREVYRVMKPGAHLVAFGGTRTYHRMVCAIEDAGFEIRDQLAWLYSQGFPKSLDVGKAIDRMRDDRADILHVTAFVRRARDVSGLTNEQVDRAVSAPGMCDHWTRRSPLQAAVPAWEQWLALKSLFAFGDEMDAEVWRLNGRKGQPGEAWHEREVVGQYLTDMGGLGGERLGRFGGDITTPATAAAKQWQGWGTALKPAHEPIVLARKPLAQPTVAAQVLATGTGALNIEAARVPTTESTVRPAGRLTSKGCKGGGYGHPDADRHMIGGVCGSDRGRWPANLVHDGSPEVLAAFAAFGERKSGELHPWHDAKPSANGSMSGGNYAGRIKQSFGGDTGTAARFFYSAKASKAERAGSKHPTVKPLALMRWLCRLVTPPGGVVLDCFAGTGVTGEAALREGFRAVLIEREAEYIADCRRRLGRLSGAETPLFADQDPAA